MRIVTLAQFMELPAGTLYSQQAADKQPNATQSLRIKRENSPDNKTWYYQHLVDMVHGVEGMTRRCPLSDYTKESFTATFIDNEICCEPYLTESDQFLFVIWEWYDVIRLINVLQWMFPFAHQQFHINHSHGKLIPIDPATRETPLLPSLVLER